MRASRQTRVQRALLGTVQGSVQWDLLRGELQAWHWSRELRCKGEHMEISRDLGTLPGATRDPLKQCLTAL
jgi:hypothetical protein